MPLLQYTAVWKRTIRWIIVLKCWQFSQVGKNGGAAGLKTVKPSPVPGVRIPLPPPVSRSSQFNSYEFAAVCGRYEIITRLCWRSECPWNFYSIIGRNDKKECGGFGD